MTPGTYLYGRITAYRAKQAEVGAILKAEERATKERIARHAEERAADRAAVIPGIHWRKAIVCVETGERFESIKIAANAKRAHRTGLSNALRGRQPTAAGFHWRYAEVA